ELSYQKLVIKIGSNVLTRGDGLPDQERLVKLSNEIAQLKKQGRQVVLVSSGAVAAGKSLIKPGSKIDVVSARQLLASVGQVKLLNNYSEAFKTHGLVCSQVLVTKDDFRDKMHYRNMLNCFDVLLQHDIIPIVNENDVISITELMFTDNDELAGLIASMIRADALFILSNVAGLFDGDPSAEQSKLIEEVDAGADLSAFITAKKSNFGRGGMLTKCNMAGKISQMGISVHIANGTTDGIVAGIMNGKVRHTRFLPRKAISGTKGWIAHTDKYTKGVVRINAGAKTALMGQRASSLLPIGIMEIEGAFEKDDVIKIIDDQGNLVGLGIARYGSGKAGELIGRKNQRPLVHYDYLYLSQESH
ncbi:MAG: glutamate 5-kinase, partial [Chitinophagaceae bacterium]